MVLLFVLYNYKLKTKKLLFITEAFHWLGWKDLNPRNDGVRVHCLTAWLHPSLFYHLYQTT